MNVLLAALIATQAGIVYDPWDHNHVTQIIVPSYDEELSDPAFNKVPSCNPYETQVLMRVPMARMISALHPYPDKSVVQSWVPKEDHTMIPCGKR